MRKIFALLLVLACFATLMACGKSEQFGAFGVDGQTLMQYGQDSITAEEATALILENAEECGQDVHGYTAPATLGDMPLPTAAFVSNIMSNYASCTLTTIYYADGEEMSQELFVEGASFKAMLESNSISPFAQLLIKQVVISPDMIAHMEAQNTAFRLAPGYDLAPVKELYSYYTDRDGNLVVQIKDYQNIAADGKGGVSCTYRQDVEIVYDSQNKISYWQASMGVSSATPTGPMAQGTIMKVEFLWQEKK